MKSIFKWFTVEGGSPTASAYTYWFANMTEPKSFTGIDRLLFCFIKYCAKLGVIPRKEFLDAYLTIDGKSDVKKYNIRTESMGTFDYKQASQLEEAYRIIASLAKTTYTEYMSEDISDRDFKVDAYAFLSNMKSQAIQDALMQTYPRLTDGSNVTEVSEELVSNLADINEAYNIEKIDEVDFAPSVGESNHNDMHYICDTGIPAIDGDIGGIYTRIMTTLTAQPKSGKTRFALAHYAYPVMMAGGDVLFYENELQKSQTENILIAHHIAMLYKGRIKIPDSLLNKSEKLTLEQKQIYESARIDLFESGRYGKFYFKKPFVVEKAKAEIMTLSRTANNLKLIVVDYMGLSKSEPTSKWERAKEEYQIISDGYKTLGDVRDALDVHILCINQFNDKGIDAAEAGKHIRPGMIQGGHIVERHTDYNIYMTYTPEQRLTNVRGLTADLVRGAEGFSDALLSVDLSVSMFRQELMR